MGYTKFDLSIYFIQVNSIQGICDLYHLLLIIREINHEHITLVDRLIREVLKGTDEVNTCAPVVFSVQLDYNE